MPTPKTYGQLSEEHDYLRAKVFKYMMSEEVKNFTGPLASIVCELVGDQDEKQADEIILAFEAA